MSLIAPDHAPHDEDSAPAQICQQQSLSSCRDSKPAVKRKAAAMGVNFHAGHPSVGAFHFEAGRAARSTGPTVGE
jgi:hypothetical protein